jgi:hypothetical protein
MAGPGAGNPGQAIGAAIGPAVGGGGAAQQVDAQQQQLQALMGQIRTVNTQVMQIGATSPVLGPLAMQVQELLKQMVVMAAQGAQAQTASGMAVPGGAAGA